MLGDALKANTTLTALDLSCQQQDEHTSKHNERARQAQRHVVGLADNRIDEGGARVLSDALKTNTTLTKLDLRCKQQDHKETQQESKASIMARGLFGQSTRLVEKERVDWVTHSRQTQH